MCLWTPLPPKKLKACAICRCEYCFRKGTHYCIENPMSTLLWTYAPMEARCCWDFKRDVVQPKNNRISKTGSCGFQPWVQVPLWENHRHMSGMALPHTRQFPRNEGFKKSTVVSKLFLRFSDWSLEPRSRKNSSYLVPDPFDHQHFTLHLFSDKFPSRQCWSATDVMP